MNENMEEAALPRCSMEVTEHVDENGRRTRYIVSNHSDGFTCLQILTEEDLQRRERHEAQSAPLRDD